MARRLPNGIPQVASIVTVDKDCRVRLSKNLLNSLNPHNEALYWSMGNEVTISTTWKDRAAAIDNSRLPLPSEIQEKIKAEPGSLLAMVERSGGFALKKLAVTEKQGRKAEVVDIETALSIERIAYTNPKPEQFMQEMRARYRKLKLKTSPSSFLKGLHSLHSYRARKLAGIADKRDGALRAELVRERVSGQNVNGSWNDDLVLTSRNLRELHDLGVKSTDTSVKKGIQWLLGRAEPLANPGMFLMSDELVAVQDLVFKERQETGKGRFRNRKVGELRQVSKGDDLLTEPCGQRVMWPNGFALEALMSFGCEKNARVQRAYETLLPGRWCECAMQLGPSVKGDSGKKGRPVYYPESSDEAFAHGGFTDSAELAKMGEQRVTGLRMKRVRQEQGANENKYFLEMPVYHEGCALITMRALTCAKDVRMRKRLDAELRAMAARQNGEGGEFSAEQMTGDRFFKNGQAFILQIVAGFDHPVAELIIMRSIPWIIANQNEDGSWGKEEYKDITTYAVLSAVMRVSENLPADFGV
jgi:hypothetical protein|tara:strand:+ start:1048 stop:2634 length:1587 start_codon:yes stop_codon:yes gene_type:complete